MSVPVDIGDEVPDFTLESHLGTVTFWDAIDGKWGLLVTFRTCFDAVATTDLGILAKMMPEFDARQITVLSIGCDTVTNYRKWIKDIEEIQTAKLNFPLIADPECQVLKQFGCAKELPSTGEVKAHCLGLFLIDIDKRIRMSTKYSTSTGRNFYEALRIFDAVSLSTYHRVVCPANWAQGQEVMLNTEMTPEEMAQYRFIEVKPWFLLTACPDS